MITLRTFAELSGVWAEKSTTETDCSAMGCGAAGAAGVGGGWAPGGGEGSVVVRIEVLEACDQLFARPVLVGLHSRESCIRS